MRPALPAARIAAALALAIFLGSCAAAPPTTASTGVATAPVSIASVVAPVESTRAAVARASLEARGDSAELEVEAQEALDGSWNGTAAETAAREAVTAALDATDDVLPGEIVLLDDSAARTAELTNGIVEEAGQRRSRLVQATAEYTRLVQAETERRATAAASAEQARRDAAAAARSTAPVPGDRSAAPAAPVPGATASGESRQERLARLGAAVGVGVPIVVGRGGCDDVIGAGQTLMGCFDTATARIYVTEQGLAKSDCTLRGVIAHEWTHYLQFSGGRVQWTADGQVANRDALESEAYGAQARWGC